MVGDFNENLVAIKEKTMGKKKKKKMTIKKASRIINRELRKRRRKAQKAGMPYDWDSLGGSTISPYNPTGGRPNYP